MKISHVISSIMIDLIHRAVERVKLPRTSPPAENPDQDRLPGRSSSLGPRPGRYHGDSVASGRRLSARRLRRWLRSG